MPRRGRSDIVAGVTVAALALPSAMAYAEVAGLSPVHGLYALLLPALAYGTVLLLDAVGMRRRLLAAASGEVA